MADVLVYVYAVGEAELATSPELSGVVGLGGAPVRVVESAGLAAVVSPVEATVFGEEPLRRRLEDIRWLADTANGHHTVVDSLSRAHPVVPLGLATVYLDEDNVRGLLNTRAAAFAEVLDRIRGRIEWGVKGFAAPDGAPAHPEPGGPDGTAGPGTAYLLRRRTARDRAVRSRQSAQEAADRVHRDLGALAVGSRRYPAQDPRLTGRRDEMVLNAAYLVDDSACATVRDAVAQHHEPGLELELTGPWPPYSFATLGPE